MTRRNFIKSLGIASALGLSGAAIGKGSDAKTSKARWKQLLPDAAYRVLFEEDTERPHTSPLYDEARAGTYICAACYQPLFDAASKFNSGTGWPSFFKPLDGAIATSTDYKLVWPRTEYHCSNCNGHHGHRFDDGPAPTGLRYCNNGVALNFVAKGEKIPALRA